MGGFAIGRWFRWDRRLAVPDGRAGPESPVVRTLRVVGALTVPRGAAPRRAPTRRGPPFLPRNGGEEGRGPLSSIGGSVGNRRRVDPATWVPARSRAGIQAFSRESPDAKSRGGGPPPPHFMTRSLALARFGGCGALFRLWGYYGAHLRTLIWNAFSCRAARPRGFPLGGSCHRR